MESWNRDQRQMVFNRVVFSLRKQGERSLSPSGTCRYRANSMPDDTKKCGIGHLIDNDAYFRRLEGKGVWHPNVMAALAVSGYTYDGKLTDVEGSDANMLKELQQAHDQVSPEFWEREFTRIAKKFELSYTPPHATPSVISDNTPNFRGTVTGQFEVQE